jgi:O-antigen/teichoic acid export membrane protein
VPGLIRLGFVLFIERNLSYEDMGKVVSDMSIVQLASFFTVIGWSGVVMGLTDKKSKIENYKKIFYSSLFTVIVAGGLVAILGGLGYVYSIFDCLLFLIAWSLYQLTKHYSLYDAEYNKIAFGEISVIAILILLLNYGVDPLSSLSVAYLIFFIINFPKSLYVFDFGMCNKEQINKSWNIAISNFALGLGIYSLPITIGHVLSKEYAGLIGIGTSFMMLLHLIPRAISNQYLPEISKSIKNNISDAIILHDKQKKISLIGSVVGLFGISILIAVVMIFDLVGLFYLHGVASILFLLAVNSIMTVIGLPITDMFNSLGETKYTARYTYIYGIMILIFTLVFIVFAENHVDLIFLLLAYALSGFLRLWMLKNKLAILISEFGNAAK